jgi:hypothetical protein
MPVFDPPQDSLNVVFDRYSTFASVDDGYRVWSHRVREIRLRAGFVSRSEIESDALRLRHEAMFSDEH